MGQCYSLDMRFKYNDKINDRLAITKDLKTFIDNHGTANFNLDKYAEKNVKPDNFDNMMKILFTDHGLIKYDDEHYESDFSASYGWLNVMFDAFDIMAKHLADESVIYMSDDSTSHTITIKNHKTEIESKDLDELYDEDEDEDDEEDDDNE